MRLDPLGLAELFLDRVTGAREGLAIDWASGYLLSRDHEMFLILAKPNRPPQDVDFSRQLLGEVQGRDRCAGNRMAGDDGLEGARMSPRSPWAVAM